MNFIKAIPATDPLLDQSLLANGWQRLKEPVNMFMLILLAIPLMIFSGGLSLWLSTSFLQKSLFAFFSDFETKGFALNISLFGIAGIILLIAIHELIHWLLIPNVFVTDNKKTSLGVSFLGYCFVYSSEEIKKSRFLLIAVAPYVIISVMLPIILGVFNLFTNYWLLLILINALGSAVDLLNSILVLVQVPQQASLCQNGQKTYFKIK